MSRFAGRSGEKRFSTLCSDEGITCNPAQEDDHGWDHVVQFPHKPVVGVPADLQRALPPVFVQTKTQSSEHPKVRMKLTNALALARSPNPCFVVIAPPSERRIADPWRATHFWGPLIGQTLKRARQAARDSVPEGELHKRWITFNLDTASSLSPNDLLPWIEQTVKEVGADYAASKSLLVGSIGFAEDRLIGTVQFDELHSIEELIDHQLGLTETIPIGKFEIRDRRFGIDVKLPIPDATGPMIGTMHANPRECLLRLRGPDFTELEFEADFLVGSLPGLPVDQCKFRIKNDFLDLIIGSSGASRFKLKYHTADKRTPVELEKLARLISWSGQGSIDVGIWLEDRRLTGGAATLDLGGSQQPFYQRLTHLIGPLAQLSSHLRNSTPTISFEEVMEADEPLVALYGFLTTPDMNVATRIEGESITPEIDQVIMYGFADVGIWRFAAITQWRALEQAIEGETWKFKVGDRHIIHRYAFEAVSEHASAAFEADFARIASTPDALIMDDNAVARLCQ
jgi:hypothetical protein